MHIIAHEPQSWFFLQHENHYYLDVNCSNSFVGFSRLIKLTEAETKAYLEKGNVFLNEFANDVQYYAQSTYADRHIMGEIGNLVLEAIMEFNAKNSL